MLTLDRNILAALIAMPGPQTIAEIAIVVSDTEAGVSAAVDARLMPQGLVEGVGAGIDITAAGKALILDSVNAVDVPADEQPVINAAFAEVPQQGDTFLAGEVALGTLRSDVAALSAGYMELMLRAAIKTGNPLLIQRGARRAAIAARYAAALPA